tara:strand:- start:313 stop:894 length:582 start_codon:yes stop_codon:yes gene_type:complete
MILSTYENAGLITICYPFMIFGWALLEESRPSPLFWKFLKIWTTVVLFIKFFYNIKWGTILEHTENASNSFSNDIYFNHENIGTFKHLFSFFKAKVHKHNEIMSYLKLGTYSYDNLSDLVWYVLPEVAILCLLMVNSIYLRLIGYKTLSELDIEDISEGIDRVLQKGDMHKVNENKVMSYNMNLYQFFESSKL